MFSGQTLKDIVVEIRNAKKELVVCPPSGNARSAKPSYHVKLSCPEIDVHFGDAIKPSLKVIRNGVVTYEDAPTSQQGAVSYRFPNISWKKTGNYVLLVEVLEGDRLLLEEERTVEVCRELLYCLRPDDN